MIPVEKSFEPEAYAVSGMGRHFGQLEWEEMRFSCSLLRSVDVGEDCALVALDLLAVVYPYHHRLHHPYPHR